MDCEQVTSAVVAPSAADPEFACPHACHNKTISGRVQMLAEMLHGIAATAGKTPTTVIIAPPREWNATGPPSAGLQKPIEDALKVTMGRRVIQTPLSIFR